MSIVNEQTPLGQALLGLCAGETGVLELPGQRDRLLSGIPSFRERPDFGAFRPSRRANGEP